MSPRSIDSGGGDLARTKTSGDENKNGVNVLFQDIVYTVPVGKKEEETLVILKSISGLFHPGKMTALMGPSGSGKTTLLDVISGRKNAGTTSGSVLFNGHSPSTSLIKRLVGYVEQFDTLVGELTVEQMLEYTAALKLPSKMTATERRKRVDEVLNMLDLHSCKDTVIGSPLIRGISGGQAKRVNIGLAMITRPKVLFLDEPTSGLDSRTANEVVELLKNLAKSDEDCLRTIVCTIHSPTGHAFSQFDDLHMLHNGRTIYDGPLVGSQAHFEELGYKRDLNCSLPEWLVDLTSDMPRLTSDSTKTNDVENNVGKPEKSHDEQTDFSVLFENSDAKLLSTLRRESVMKSIDTNKTEAPYDNDNTPPGEWSKLLTLLRYRMVAHYKDGEYVGTRFGDKIVFALLILSLYFKIGNKSDSQSIASTASLLYFICAICGYGAAAFVPSLTLERALYYRELNDGCYKPATYYLSKFIEEGVMATVTSFLFSLIVYFGSALQGSFFIFLAAYYLTTMMGIILAYAVAALVPSMEAANAILPTLVTVWMYFGGLFIVFDKIPTGWYWFSWTSFLRYSWGSIMLNQFQNQENGELPVFFGENGEPLNVLEFYGLRGSIMGSVGACIGMLTAVLAFFSVVGIAALVYVRHEKR